MISSTRELGSFMPKDGSFSNRNESQKERLRFVPAPMVSLGRTVSRVEMNAKYAPLTPSFPNRRYPMLFLRPKTQKRALTKPTLSYTALQFTDQLLVRRQKCMKPRHCREDYRHFRQNPLKLSSSDESKH